jgi:hypothetical protein
MSLDEKIQKIFHPKPKTLGFKVKGGAARDSVRFFNLYSNAQLKKSIRGQENIVFTNPLEAEASATDEDLITRTKQ